ncbi:MULTISPECIES: T7SS effector LXG polymorphic toxin [unclassified Bacillus (in: firmicutes)]|uniref:ribonuclease YeeF family protein n=1 Tax=unclassified Bacillus (in: firmicutes) TaxID=185979 RepID=UPI00227DC804|nr:T7SS effector LXG polymorphic toxin [Bacillus sp. S20C3]MCY8288454.1 T7SS effector LXG polymorphic toxin [Bacillus sp. N13C7]MCY8640141.1 T7SS effector LXG polymorphic toxin [Bacillus sp. S17B2]MCY9142537.1 T7SS effector LXG polymorphic toxin [Bacillus sp. T9C1]
MSKVFESKSLIEEAKSRKKQYETLEEQLNTLKKAFQEVADLGDNFKGKGADNIKAFFQGQGEIVDSWLTLVSAQIAFLNGVSGDIKDQELNDSYVETSFLDHELPNGDLKASEIVSAHKEEIDSILSGISDIIDLDMYTLDDYADKMGDAQKIRRDTITAVDQLDESLTTEYQNLESLDNAVLTKYSVLMQATSNGKSASPMYYDKKAFHSNEVYKSVIEVEKQGTTYIDAKAQQAEARRLQEKAEEEANKPWYEKTWDGVCNFTGEVTGYYDYKRATEGVDPVTGEKLSTAERVTAGAMAAAGFIPVVGWAGRAFKGGKAIYKTGKAAIAAEHALDAYKTGKSLDILKMSEMGAYGLVASNGFSEAVTGRDMFGNKVSEEKRKSGALEAALSLVGAGALAKHIDKGIPLATHSKVQKANKTLEKVKQFKVPTNVRVYAERPVTPEGFTFGIPTVRVDVEKTAVKDLGIVKMVSSGKGIKGTGKRNNIDIGKADLDALRKKWNVPETETIAVGKTDIKGLEDLTFKGGSPKVRKEAGLPDLDEIMPDRNIKAPGNNPLFTRHAEEGVLNEFDSAVIKADIKPEDVTGTLRLHQSNPSGVCRKCYQGLANDKVPPGVLKQLSLKYPNLKIEVTSEMDESIKVTGRLNLMIKNGKYIE